ncbi:MAG: hypothetical protein ABIV51_05020 [Saprospiraceae bacterium]
MFFGEVIEGKMKLSLIGTIAKDIWFDIANHAKSVTLGEMIVMPNHLHGILILDNSLANETNVVSLHA